MSLMSGYLCHLILCATIGPTSSVILLLMLPYSSCYHGSYSFSYIVTCITLFPVLAWVLLLQLSCLLYYPFLCVTIGLNSYLVTSVTNSTCDCFTLLLVLYLAQTSFLVRLLNVKSANTNVNQFHAFPKFMAFMKCIFFSEFIAHYMRLCLISYVSHRT